jgi:hypothetical protein
MNHVIFLLFCLISYGFLAFLIKVMPRECEALVMRITELIPDFTEPHGDIKRAAFLMIVLLLIILLTKVIRG